MFMYLLTARFESALKKLEVYFCNKFLSCFYKNVRTSEFPNEQDNVFI